MFSENLKQIKLGINEASEKCGRDPRDLTIVAVTKYVGIEEIREAIEAGITVFGENKVQDAFLKYSQIKQRILLHLVGHLQSNKAKMAVEIFDLIQSVESLKLATQIDIHAKSADKIQDILVQVNTSNEATKSGIKPEETLDFLKQLKNFKNIRVQGLMTIGPLTDNPENARPGFRKLKELYDKINELTILSMGMTDDYQIAIEEGANMLRLGRVLFK